MLFTALTLGLGATAAYVSSRCFFRVEEGHRAVLVSFGAAVRSPEDPARLAVFGPGLHRKKPWQEARRVPVMEQNLDLAGPEGGRTAMAADGTVLRLDATARWSPVEERLESFLFGMEEPEAHLEGLFSCLLRNEIANVEGAARAAAGGSEPARASDADLGSYALIRRERASLGAAIEAFRRSEIGDRYGVTLHAVDLRDILPPDELGHALNAVMNARSEAEAHHARAESDVRQRVLAAERGIAIATARAKAAEIEARRACDDLALLEKEGALGHYVARRRAEVLSEARMVFLKGGSAS